MTAKSGQRNARLIELLARGVSQVDAARQTGISDRTVRRRLADPEFRRQVEKFRGTMVESAAGKLASLLDEAADTLQALMKPDVPAGIRLSAARAALEHCCRIRETVELERRVAELETHFSQGESK